jgi:hypothetical protein
MFMKRILIFIPALAIASSVLGCSASAKRTKVDPAANSRNVQNRGNADLPLPTVQATAEAASPTPTQVPVKRRGTKERVPGDPNATPAPLVLAPAAENSEYGTSMERDGTVLEVRKFRKHPLLAKVELRWTDPSMKTARFHMNDGKVIEIRTAAIKDLPSMTAAALMQLIPEAPAATGDRPRIMNSPR